MKVNIAWNMLNLMPGTCRTLRDIGWCWGLYSASMSQLLSGRQKKVWGGGGQTNYCPRYNGSGTHV